MSQMGHGQTAEDLNLGLGWVYYGLARALMPSSAVVIGSMRGFVPLVIAKALQDNGRGEVTFIDPSFVDAFWMDPKKVDDHFSSHGIHNVHHFRHTTQEFVLTEDFQRLENVGLLFVDGYHSEEQARFDHESFAAKMTANGVVLFHDSVRERVTRIYGEDRAYTHTVNRYMDHLRADRSFEVLAIPVADGLTIVRRACP
jgi:predicted O-methyltransferase YrrM